MISSFVFLALISENICYLCPAVLAVQYMDESFLFHALPFVESEVAIPDYGSTTAVKAFVHCYLPFYVY